MTSASPVTDPLRATGRTTRAILQALIYASEGKSVAFVSATHAVARHHSKLALRIAEAAGILAPESSAWVVRIGTGHVRFIGPRDRVEGYREVMHDHYVEPSFTRSWR